MAQVRRELSGKWQLKEATARNDSIEGRPDSALQPYAGELCVP